MPEGPVNQQTLFVCQGTGCLSGRSDLIRVRLEEEIKRLGLEERVKVKFSGCHGFCERGPIVDVDPEGIFYTEVKPEDAEDIAASLLPGGKPVERLFYRDPVTGEAIPHYTEVPFYSKQQRLILRGCGHINPEEIEDYLAIGGYQALKTALFEMTPEQVIEEVKKSGLRGRGGAGFPTGTKWEFCRRSPGMEKYLICNADEGDPGAFMDRSVLEASPHSVIEGMVIAAYAMGCTAGYIYARAEYPLAIKRLRIALRQAQERNFLGKNILGSNFSFDIQVKEGAGAFVCGEETALMASIEGRRGVPRPRPPFPAQAGLWGKPTNINNVKTFASVPVIISRGAEWYAAIGTEKSKGTAVFALTGKIANSGLVEVPMGTPLEKIIFEIGGGIPGNRRFKAVQTGGPSGGCLPANLLNLPVEYESLAEAGSIMGSGGMVVVDEDTCMVDLAKYFLSFTQKESCGKCVPCRVGTRQMLELLERISQGQGQVGDIDKLVKMGEMVKSTSLCALGGTAPNPVLTTIRYFREEYEEHIKKHHCRAAVCKGLVKAPCTHTCPAGIDAARYVRLILQGKFAESLAVIRERVPFPAVLGRVCFHPCEAKCRRGQLEQAIAIRALKRAAAEYGGEMWKENSRHLAPTGKRVAIVGSGPAGLTAAYYLAKLGHSVTVFEALPEPGGMMRVGIPEYRLPRDILSSEIEEITRAGVEIKTNHQVNSVEELFQQGYHAIFLALGAHQGMRMGVTGEDSPGVLECVSFLRQINLGNKVELGSKVAVVGGGNAAIDAARTALRLRAREVTILYRRTQAEMPASEEEVREALHEGVDIQFLVAPSQVTRDNGRLRLECRRMELGRVDASGRRRPEPVPGSEFILEFDTVIAAVGQMPDAARFGLPTGRGNTLQVDPDTLATPREGVFAGGDVVTGPASVIEAIAQGRQAAISIDRYLGGEGDIEEKLAPPDDLTSLPGIEEGEKYRPDMPLLLREERLRGFAEVEKGYSADVAREEAGRCLRCDLEERE
jgi:NADH-quinone oxidoreductase subunit F